MLLCQKKKNTATASNLSPSPSSSSTQICLDDRRQKKEMLKNVQEKSMYYLTLRPQGGSVVIIDMYQEEYENLLRRQAERSSDRTSSSDVVLLLSFAKPMSWTVHQSLQTGSFYCLGTTPTTPTQTSCGCSEEWRKMSKDLRVDNVLKQRERQWSVWSERDLKTEAVFTHSMMMHLAPTNQPPANFGIVHTDSAPFPNKTLVRSWTATCWVVQPRERGCAR